MSSIDEIDILIRNRTLDGGSCGEGCGIAIAAESFSTSAVNIDMPSAQRLRLSRLFARAENGNVGEVSALLT